MSKIPKVLQFFMFLGPQRFLAVKNQLGENILTKIGFIFQAMWFFNIYLQHYFDYHVHPSVRCHKIFFRLNHLGITPRPPGLTPHPNPPTPGARSPSGGASKGPKGPF